MKYLEEFKLTAQNIDSVVEHIRDFLKQQKVSKNDVIKAALTVDTILLTWMEQSSEVRNCHVRCSFRFRRPCIDLSCDGEQCNPLHSVSASVEFSNMMLGNLALSTEYSYQDKNIVTIRLPRKNFSTVMKLAAGIAAGGAAAVLLQSFLDPETVRLLNNDILNPVFSKLMKLMATVASFMIFFSLAAGIGNMESFTKLNDVGRTVLGVFFGCLVFSVAFAMAAGIFVFDVMELRGDVSFSIVTEIIKRLLDFVPDSLLAPFIAGHNMQIIFWGLVTGIIVLTLGRQTGRLVEVVNDLNVFFNSLIIHFCDLMPFIIFLSTLTIILGGNFGDYVKVMKIALTHFGCVCMFTLSFCFLVAWRWKMSLIKYFVTLFPVILNGFCTCSSVATLPLIEKTVSEKFHLKKDFLDFTIPLSLVFSRAGSSAGLVVVALGMLEIYNVHFSLSGMVVLGLALVFFAFSVSPVPGSALAVYVVMMQYLKMPPESLGFCIIAEVVLDFVSTTGNVTNSTNAILLCAHRLGSYEKV